MEAAMDSIVRLAEPPIRADYRCPECGSLLFRAKITLAERESLEIVCKRCKTAVVFVAAKGEVA